MTAKAPDGPVRMAFERKSLRLPIADIQPLRRIGAAVKKTVKYQQIRASIREVGIIEPPIVWPPRSGKGKYLLLNGHLRLEALKDLGETEVVCLIATDDEAFTYNRHISRVATIQEHKMILKAVERGVSPERIARALNVDPVSLREKIRLLDGICPEAAELLKDKHVPLSTFRVLRKMLPMRQIEVAEKMVSMNCYTSSFAQSLLAATPQAELVELCEAEAGQGPHRSADGADGARVGQSRARVQDDRGIPRNRYVRSRARRRLSAQAARQCRRRPLPRTAPCGDSA